VAKQIVKQFIGATDGSVTVKSKAAITIGVGLRRTLAIPCFSEGRVTHLYIKQVSGTNVAFDVELLSSKVPYPVGTPAYNAAAAQNPNGFRAIPKQTQVVSGNALEYWDSWGTPFVNQDQAGHTVNERFLYLTIIPVNLATSSTWEVTLVLASDASD
jgi:hypothetical protein